MGKIHFWALKSKMSLQFFRKKKSLLYTKFHFCFSKVTRIAHENLRFDYDHFKPKNKCLGKKIRKTRIYVFVTIENLSTLLVRPAAFFFASFSSSDKKKYIWKTNTARPVLLRFGLLTKKRWKIRTNKYETLAFFC